MTAAIGLKELLLDALKIWSRSRGCREAARSKHPLLFSSQLRI